MLNSKNWFFIWKMLKSGHSATMGSKRIIIPHQRLRGQTSLTPRDRAKLSCHLSQRTGRVCWCLYPLTLWLHSQCWSCLTEPHSLRAIFLTRKEQLLANISLCSGCKSQLGSGQKSAALFSRDHAGICALSNLVHKSVKPVHLALIQFNSAEILVHKSA